MKIIKSFEDYDFYESTCDPVDGHTWYWGLSDDGQIYCTCTEFNKYPSFYKYKEITGHRITSIKTMQKIIKNFGDLIPFI